MERLSDSAIRQQNQGIVVGRVVPSTFPQHGAGGVGGLAGLLVPPMWNPYDRPNLYPGPLVSTALDGSKARVKELEAEVAELRARLVRVSNDDPPQDYHGPLDGDGRPVPNQPHESFHESIKDVLAGRIIPKAMRQMSDAIDKMSARSGGTTKELPPGALGGETRDRRKMGWVL